MGPLQNLSTRQQLIGVIVSVALAFSALVGWMASRQLGAAKALDVMYEVDYHTLSAIGRLDGLLTRADINILRMIAIGDPASIARWKEENTARFASADELIAQLKRSAHPSLQNDIAGLESAYGAMRRGMDNQAQAIATGDLAAGAEINRTQVKDNADRTFQALTTLKSAQDKLSKERVAGEQAAADRSIVWALVGCAFLLAGACLVAVLMSRTLQRQLGGEPADAVRLAEALAAGDLTYPIAVTPGDTRSMMARLHAMQRSLAGVVGQVRQNSESVATASAQIAQGNQDLSGRTEQQASALQQTAATMEQLGTTVRHNADSARHADQLAQAASSVAAQGGEVVGKVVATMRGINDSSRKIGDIIGTIDGIAFQTNILALNAAVEAARAGEQGRGFAVVAAEVRSLAQRSAEAAKEIKGLIGHSVEQVEQGSTLVDEAGSKMEEIVHSIQRVSGIVAEISGASVEQSNGVQQVGQAVQQMDQTTQQNAALVEEGAAAAESLKNQARQLVQVVSAFKV